jgi:hypothetical protein
MFRLCAVVSALVVCCAAPARATSYLPVTFDELITRADAIFVGEVVDVRPYAIETRGETIIRTRVVFRVTEGLFGTSTALEVLDFFGGELNGVGMAIADMPTFSVGDRRVVFASRQPSINPIVGFTQGLLQIDRDGSGVDRVWTLDGFPLAQPESIGTGRATVVTPLLPMRLSDLRDRIGRAVAQERRQ